MAAQIFFGAADEDNKLGICWYNSRRSGQTQQRNGARPWRLHRGVDHRRDGGSLVRFVRDCGAGPAAGAHAVTMWIFKVV